MRVTTRLKLAWSRCMSCSSIAQKAELVMLLVMVCCVGFSRVVFFRSNAFKQVTGPGDACLFAHCLDDAASAAAALRLAEEHDKERLGLVHNGIQLLLAYQSATFPPSLLRTGSSRAL